MDKYYYIWYYCFMGIKNKNDKYFLGEQEFNILREIVSELGILTISVLTSAGSTRQLYKTQSDLRWKRQNRKRVIKKLEKDGFLKVEKDNVIMTELGKKIFLQNKMIKDNSLKKKKWDGKWRVVMFDLPIDKNNTRVLLRRILIKAGFLQIQKSVYIFPHSLKEFYLFLKEHREFKDNIIYSEITRSTAEREWKEHFKDIII